MARNRVRRPRKTVSRANPADDARDRSVPAGRVRRSGSRPAGGAPNPDADIEAFNRYTGIRSLLNPLWCYHGFRISVLALICFGVIMVFSSSSVTMISEGSSPWKQALSQGIYCILGFIAGFVAMHIPVAIYRKFGLWFVGFSILLQLLTITPLGIEVNGNTGWIGLPGGFTLQPAEVMKLALCIWLPSAMEISRRFYRRDGIKAYLVPALVFLACLGAVMLGKDLGTTMILIMIGAAAFLVGGFPGRWLASIFACLAIAVAAFVITSPNRLDRVMAAYKPCTAADAQSVCYQAIHAKYAMASGGFLGVGIGNSREKWNYLPEAHNDFIFAIIGEETGFVGAAMVIVLFAVLGWCMISIAVQSTSPYVSMTLVCITVWIVGQSLINVMVVVGMLPVMGLPMPFVSAGGSSLIMCIIAAGIAVDMMRTQPQIKADSSALSS